MANMASPAPLWASAVAASVIALVTLIGGVAALIRWLPDIRDPGTAGDKRSEIDESLEDVLLDEIGSRADRRLHRREFRERWRYKARACPLAALPAPPSTQTARSPALDSVNLPPPA